MFNNTVIAGSMFLAFGTTGRYAPLWAWGVLGVIAVGLDVVQILTKSVKIVLPVVGLTSMPNTAAEAQAQGLDLSALAGAAAKEHGADACKCGKAGCPSTAAKMSPHAPVHPVYEGGHYL